LGVTANIKPAATLARKTVSLLRRSQFAQDAGVLLVLNLLSKGVMFLGTAYMARCLGPTKLGISGLVFATAQQAALVFHGGFDMVAVRRIAVEKSRCHSIVRPITSLRIWTAFVVSFVWAAVCLVTKSNSELYVWLMGAPILLLLASNLSFTFQGLEKLPLQNAMNAGGSVLMGLAYFAFFRPGMRLGSDLIVYILVGIIILLFSHLAYRRINAGWAFGAVDFQFVRGMLTQSWKYWLWGICVFYYSVFQVPLIKYVLGARQAGLYRVAFTMAAGVEILFNSITSLLLPRLAVWHAAGPSQMWEKQLHLLKLFLALGVPPIAALLLVSRPILRVLLGPEFEQSCLPFQILIVGRLIVFLGQIFAFGMAAAQQDTLFLLIMAASSVFSVSANLLVLGPFGLPGAATVSVATESLIFFFSFLFARRVLTSQDAFGEPAGGT